jgi:16S rRNA (adenine1518-N6/adenine1519-N6)-dimethyltransferase
VRLVYDVRLLRRVGAELFWPRPRVESAVARLELRPGRRDPLLVERFDRLVEGLFQARRKALGGRLGELWGDRGRALEVLGALSIDPRARVETLSVELLLELARRDPGCAE